MFNVELATKILYIVGLVVVMYGSITNLICSALCCFSTGLRQYPTFIFYAVISFFDSFIILPFNIESFLNDVLNISAGRYSLSFVQTSFYLICASTNVSSWLLVITFNL